ncbi:hypothetical protein ABIE61_003025 [Marinobacterium sp. MBR-111]|uniref:hypothetical protein n=1 Tax=Marinobacterium sp. MBR-111 TaxID=3156463 RepID=UPI0033912F4A
MKIKFETAYRKLDLEKDEFELLGDFIRIFREEFADDHELDQYEMAWRWNLKQDVHLNRSSTFKGLMRQVYCSINQVNSV